ncbi:Uncharacterized protein FWK35_00034196 [Aphis craccivora]|uniref:Uncharacterized protein n=1 Tax=Aphis craccivora TaxID=307492 RepID=A0A6G0YAH0_APHCR|nr:Uncharacterized protein FWK35_00034196 [Aphis craccivora]
MASIIVMFIITIIAFTIRGAEITITEKDLTTTSQGILYRCPALISTEYQVTLVNSVTVSTTGCAYLMYTEGDVIKQSYMVWFGTEEYGGEDCHDLRMSYYSFSCLTKNLVLTKDRYEGLMLLRIREEDYNESGTSDYKCALYEGLSANRSSFRFAISQNASCTGLLDVLYPPPNMMFTEFNKEATLITFNSKQANVDNNVRKRRHGLSDIIGGNRGHGSVMFLQSTNTSTTTDDKSMLRQSLKLENIN